MHALPTILQVKDQHCQTKYPCESVLQGFHPQENYLEIFVVFQVLGTKMCQPVMLLNSTTSKVVHEQF